MLAGLAAGVLMFAFAKVFGEPQVDKAIAFEEATSPPSNEAPLVSRAMQSTLGLLTGTIVYAVALGGIFALVFAAVQGRIGLRGGEHEREDAADGHREDDGAGQQAERGLHVRLTSGASLDGGLVGLLEPDRGVDLGLAEHPGEGEHQHPGREAGEQSADQQSADELLAIHHLGVRR